MADVATSEILLADLPTKSVTIAPSRATVVREITTKIQPGPNEITILGLDPDVNFDSVRIEGSGLATITDIQTQTVPRREQFEDVYPEESDEEDSDTDEDAEPVIDSAELRGLRAHEDAVKGSLAAARNDQAMSLDVLGFLGAYAKNMQPEHTKTDQFEDFIERYIARRGRESSRNHTATMKIAEDEQKLAEIQKKIDQAKSRLLKDKKTSLKEARREREKRRKEREQKKRQQQRRRNELRRFWSTTIGQVTVSLDSSSASTPGSSRRSSVTDRALLDEKASSANQDVEVTLRLSYVVPLATWISRYELGINTPSSSARLVYRAEFQNFSRETWRDARVTLSTSQASFSGLEERIPTLHPWHVKLTSSQKDSPSWDNILQSLHEATPLFKARKAKFVGTRARRQVTPQQQPQQPQQQPQTASLFGALAQQQPQTASPFGSAAQQQPQSATLFGSAASQPTQGRSLFARAAPPPPAPDAAEDSQEDEIESPLPYNLEYQDSVRQEYGLTTTYDLPGRRTLAPSTVKRRHALAEIDLKSIILSHIIVPKHRVAAFLHARIKNTSSIAILHGHAGITVDGAFLGTSEMPSCAPNDFVNVSLGVDPSILVTYAKPTLRRAAGGFFTKDDTAVFQRRCSVKNTKSVAANITVLDQVPVSEDEKLPLQILQPKGLVREGDREDVEIESAKGKGSVRLGKSGEVKWEIELQPGKEIQLVLEYELKAPSGSDVCAA